MWFRIFRPKLKYMESIFSLNLKEFHRPLLKKLKQLQVHNKHCWLQITLIYRMLYKLTQHLLLRASQVLAKILRSCFMNHKLPKKKETWQLVKFSKQLLFPPRVLFGRKSPSWQESILVRVISHLNALKGITNLIKEVANLLIKNKNHIIQVTKVFIQLNLMS